MENIIDKLFLVIFGGIIGSYITSRFELLKAWKSYTIVRAEIDRNLSLLGSIRFSTTPIYSPAGDNQQEQIDQMLNSYEDKIPVNILLLLKVNMPSWSYRAWESQLHFLAQILTESQVKGVFDVQVDLERLSTIHARLVGLVATQGDSANSRAVELFKEWETLIDKRLQYGNPLLPATVCTKIASVIGIQQIVWRISSFVKSNSKNHVQGLRLL